MKIFTALPDLILLLILHPRAEQRLENVFLSTVKGKKLNSSNKPARNVLARTTET